MAARRQGVLAPQKWWLPTGAGAAPAPAWTPHAPPPRSAGALASSAEPPAPWAGRRRQIYVSSGALWPCQIQAVQTGRVALLPSVSTDGGKGKPKASKTSVQVWDVRLPAPASALSPLPSTPPLFSGPRSVAGPGTTRGTCVRRERRSAIRQEAQDFTVTPCRLHRSCAKSKHLRLGGLMRATPLRQARAVARSNPRSLWSRHERRPPLGSLGADGAIASRALPCLEQPPSNPVHPCSGLCARRRWPAHRTACGRWTTSLTAPRKCQMEPLT